MNRTTTALRTISLGLLLLSGATLAQDTPPTTPPPTTPPTEPAPPTTPPTDTPPATDPAPATPAEPAPAQTPAAPATAAPVSPTLTPLAGEQPLKTVTTVLGQAVIYAGSVKDVLPRTLEQLKAEGYTVQSQTDTGATLEKDGQTAQLSVRQQLGVVTVSLSRVLAPAGAAPTSTEPAAEPASPATGTEPAAPADPEEPAEPGSDAPADPAAPPTAPQTP